MSDLENRAAAAYREHFHQDPAVMTAAPGRVNLIGEHTDYNQGFVLPIAIDRFVVTAMDRGEGGLYSVDYTEERALGPADGSWADYPRGVAWALEEKMPFQATFAGNVPRGSGLSSSAAIEAATALALDTLFHLQCTRSQLALACQRAENQFVGVNSGIMDQYASLLSRAGHAMLLDCRTLEMDYVPLDLAAAGLALVICDTRVERTLAGSGYNERRATTEQAARALGVASLRDAGEADLCRLTGLMRQRARHVITENARVLEAVDALRRKDYVTFGRLMYASHTSLRDDYDVSIPPLDTFVDVAHQTGALGARLTGAGFGGCAIALIEQGKVETLADFTRRHFAAHGFTSPEFYQVMPASGAMICR